ncbi:hypothetical protein PV416_24890 [Streptomyces ipomoeae]|uniref:Uncharacterized protein n=1 Tax=Streptomyces ipomoeae 91-03 TaxID=698759 RepID=L1KR64_9ACTN|nr:hypothetical protein [Streptomyces ipomoeae]EKX62853.1 hypothetical protein STRIP9103_08752 [Streptomyces ipomoeae 91-03]MDX2695239.1 hypothetical protein [Streptomyces ipomoeae]MDX2824244.1 hypothetical protein [Streptomyces ipomoeae]MDX2841257.1 hypothetical protein [Streptomyces ipomoeae]MDX2876873.1 hypothetical protein [Streptomyces ipomoeae]
MSLKTPSAAPDVTAETSSGHPAARLVPRALLRIPHDGPAAFGGDTTTFAEAVATTLSTLKGPPAADDTEGPSYSGERSAAVAAERGAKGIPVASKPWRDLTERAKGLGVTVTP